MCHSKLSARQKFHSRFGGVAGETIVEPGPIPPRCRYRLRQGSKRLDPDYVRLLGIVCQARPKSIFHRHQNPARQKCRFHRCASRPYRPHSVCNNSRGVALCSSGALLTFSEGKLRMVSTERHRLALADCDIGRRRQREEQLG